jgi:hypothetical protein
MARELPGGIDSKELDGIVVDNLDALNCSGSGPSRTTQPISSTKIISMTAT